MQYKHGTSTHFLFPHLVALEKLVHSLAFKWIQYVKMCEITP